MPVIKQISVYDGSEWKTDDIGANAGNIELLSSDGNTASTVAGSTNLLTGLTNILPTNALTASRALISDVNGKIAFSSVTSTQLGHLSGVTGNIQTQINGINTIATANNLGSAIDLNSYAAGTLYTFPKDGYIVVTASASSAAILRIYSANNNLYVYWTVSATSMPVFVRKGMRLDVRQKNGTVDVKFQQLG